LNNSSGGNNTDSIIFIKPHWKKGETKKYEIIQKTKVSFYNIQIISEISLTVKDSRKNYFGLEWRYDTIKEQDSLFQDSGQPKKLSPVLLLKGKTIKYHTDKKGKIIEISNFSELSQQLKTSIDSLVPSFMHSLMPNYFKSFLLKDLLTFHKLYGQQLKIGDTTILNLKDSINPNIDFASESKKINLSYRDLKTGTIRIEGKSLGIDETKSASDFIYEFSPFTFWMKKYKSSTNTSVHGTFITYEYEIILLP
jgi:hypothetical protein